ncbi:MAG: hypothetical protein HC772_05860 [Leptolyngbyaceae cyanobacterium CRU_2_3]|nr:hypothetical protein [Leptolyngbyaceae cyanobacterium CRU_2_3]
MSPSRRYQSNLFNFLSRQSMRLRDQTGQTWRQAKMAAVWGVQILLYPLYVGFQATRLAGKQLRHTVRQVLPKLQAIQQPQPLVKPGAVKSGAVVEAKAGSVWVADTPIQRSLQFLTHFQLVLPGDRTIRQLDPHDTDSPGMRVVIGGSALSGATAIQPAAIQVQGIASLLGSHRLVLVGVENQLLDVLSPDQQMLLQRHLVWDLAIYWRQQRTLATAQSSPWVDRFLPLPKDRPQALPPIRAFWQVMTWMQASPVAIATDLFQESRLMAALPLTGLPRLEGTGSLVSLRSAQPDWQSTHEMLNHLSHWVRHRLQNLKNVALQPLALQPLARSPKAIQDQSIQDAAPATHQPWLTEADLFNPNRSAQAWMSELRSTLSQPLTNLPAEYLMDQHQQNPDLSHLRSPQNATERSLARSLRSTRRSSIRSNEWDSVADTEPAVQPDVKLDLQSTATHTDSSQPASGDLATVSRSSQDELIAKPTWIEAEVRLVTYEKHPIERLLNWIDRGMSWIETKAADVWQWFRDRWSA